MTAGSGKTPDVAGRRRRQADPTISFAIGLIVGWLLGFGTPISWAEVIGLTALFVVFVFTVRVYYTEGSKNDNTSTGGE